jgi:uncharacterized protein YybS (DUF2232 family)
LCQTSKAACGSYQARAYIGLAAILDFGTLRLGLRDAVTFKEITAVARVALASALMFLAGAVVPLVGGVTMVFAPVPLLIYSVGLPHALSRISAAIALSAALVAAGGGMAAAIAYLASFGLAAAVICVMLERRQPFELIVLGTTVFVISAGTVAALSFAGSPSALVQITHDQLAAGLIRGESFYKGLGVETTIAPDVQAYLVDSVMRLAPALIALLSALMVLLNLAVLWKWSGKQQRIGYALFGDLARWSAPEWLVWPLLISGFSWFVPIVPVATIALDCFLCLVAVYFCQGLAIMAFYFKQLRMPAVARGLIYFVTLAQPVLMAIVGAAGVFDLWVDFRRMKGPHATARNLGDFL